MKQDTTSISHPSIVVGINTDPFHHNGLAFVNLIS